MSLELKIEELIAAVKLLTSVMSSAGEATVPAGDVGTEAGGEEGKAKRTRRTKAQIDADAAAAGAGATATAETVVTPTVKTNTSGVVLYAIIDKHNTAAAIQPGEIIPSVEGIRQVTEAEYNAYKAQQAAALAPAATQPATDITFPSLVARLTAVHGKGGNPAVMAVLGKFGAANVPALASKPLADVAAAINEQEVALGLAAAPAGASLFG